MERRVRGLKELFGGSELKGVEEHGGEKRKGQGASSFVHILGQIIDD